MKRTLEFTDVMAVIGMVATMFGGYLFYQVSYGWGIRHHDPR